MGWPVMETPQATCRTETWWVTVGVGLRHRWRRVSVAVAGRDLSVQGATLTESDSVSDSAEKRIEKGFCSYSEAM